MTRGYPSRACWVLMTTTVLVKAFMTRGYPRLGIDMVTVLSLGLATIDSVAFMMTSDNSQLDLDNK